MEQKQAIDPERQPFTLSDAELMQAAGEEEPGTERHYDLIMEVASRGLHDSQAALPPATPAPTASVEAGERLSPEKLEQFQALRDKARAEMRIYKSTRTGDLMVRFTRLEYILDESDALQLEVKRLQERNIMLTGERDDTRRDVQELHQQLTASRAALEDAFQEAARLQQELAEVNQAYTGALAEWKQQHLVAAARLLRERNEARAEAKEQAARILAELKEAHGQGDWFNIYTLMEDLSAPAQTPPPATPEAREAGGEDWYDGDACHKCGTLEWTNQDKRGCNVCKADG